MRGWRVSRRSRGVRKGWGVLATVFMLALPFSCKVPLCGSNFSQQSTITDRTTFQSGRHCRPVSSLYMDLRMRRISVSLAKGSTGSRRPLSWIASSPHRLKSRPPVSAAEGCDASAAPRFRDSFVIPPFPFAQIEMRQLSLDPCSA
jgi:hypothetical protein